MHNKPSTGAPLSMKIAGGVSLATFLASVTGASLIDRVPHTFSLMLPVLVLCFLSFLMMLFVASSDWQPGINDGTTSDEV